MSELTVKDRILNVLVSNTDTWLTSQKIAELGYGEAYIRDSRNALNAKIARNVNGAITNAMESGIVVFSECRMKPKKEYEKDCRDAASGAKSSSAKQNAIERVSLFNKYTSYKIASDTDSEIIENQLHRNQEKVARYIEKRGIIIETLSMRNLLPDEYTQLKLEIK